MRTLQPERYAPLRQSLAGPRIIPIQDCWTTDCPPNTLDIRTAVLKAFLARRSSLTATNYAGDTCDPVMFLSYLMGQLEDLEDTARWNLLNIDISDSKLNTVFKIPEAQLNVRWSHLNRHNLQSNMGLAGSIVGPHTDQGPSGVNFVIGCCAKLWLVWPPSDKNRAHLGKIRRDPDTHKYDWGGFEQGLAVSLTKTVHVGYDTCCLNTGDP